MIAINQKRKLRVEASLRVNAIPPENSLIVHILLLSRRPLPVRISINYRRA
jgi:hypothetical protein